MATRRCRLFHVDAFTRERFCGNPAVVVLDADELTEEQMQTIAAEVNGETAFVLEAEDTDHDMRVKFFTPRLPAPFVGHATIAAQYVLAKKQGRPSGKVRQQTGAGIVEVEVMEAEGDLRVAVTQNPPSLGPIIPDHHRSQVLNALGVSSPSLHVDCPLQILTKGSSRLLIGLKSPDLLDSIKPDFAELARLTSHVGAEGYFVFALHEEDGRLGALSRMFVPALGIPEDPVSGNAHGMLGVYLVSHELLTPQDGRVAFRGRQGMWMRRPGVVDVEVETTGRVAQSVRIMGDAVILYEAEIQV
ncbi:MAG TPA: PhzF family phenazine biosynthesis isomerase [Steroidobacter sp.]|jgi:PhzF family phenazine biosynthesis protein|nr:PhzF family phenazine biosynthesis isomerase [Steroidobacteraceae bacterium]HLS81883.1 PhzF family phenazine biosynthesis isomerase [Steroidobacter sp.]